MTSVRGITERCLERGVITERGASRVREEIEIATSSRTATGMLLVCNYLETDPSFSLTRFFKTFVKHSLKNLLFVSDLFYHLPLSDCSVV